MPEVVTDELEGLHATQEVRFGVNGATGRVEHTREFSFYVEANVAA